MRDVRNRIVHDYLPKDIRQIYDAIQNQFGNELKQLQFKLIDLSISWGSKLTTEDPLKRHPLATTVSEPSLTRTDSSPWGHHLLRFGLSLRVFLWWEPWIWIRNEFLKSVKMNQQFAKTLEISHRIFICAGAIIHTSGQKKDGTVGEIYNAGGDHQCSNIDLVNLLCDLVGNRLS